jgi:1-acyl-sn-glycerol-3-phosphate acyltransferase
MVCYVPFLEPVRVEYRGGDLPPVSIMVSNHNSAIDPYLYGAVNVENGFITSWPFKIPVYSLFMRLAEYINSEEGWEVVEGKSRYLLDGGCSITIWPEGHRSRDGRLGRFKNGAFTLSVDTGYPVVPVCILGSGKVLPPGSRLFNRGKVTLIVLAPCRPVEGLNREEQVRELRNRVEQKIKEVLDDYDHFNSGMEK